MLQASGLIGFTIYAISSLLNIYSLLILIRALLSWFSPNPYNRLYQLLIRVTEPVLGPIRRIVPLQGIDISPLVAILLIDLVIKKILIGLLSSALVF
jgi:YggT family protein